MESGECVSTGATTASEKIDDVSAPHRKAEVIVQADNFGSNSAPEFQERTDLKNDVPHSYSSVEQDQLLAQLSVDSAHRTVTETEADVNNLPTVVSNASSGASSASMNDPSRQLTSPTPAQLVRKKDGTFARVPYVGTSERRMLPAPGSLDHWASANHSLSIRIPTTLETQEELHGMVSSALAQVLAQDDRSPMTVRERNSSPSPSYSPKSGLSPSESPKGPRSGSSSVSHPLEELLVAANLQTMVSVKPGLLVGCAPRSFKWSPSTSRGSSLSPKLSPASHHVKNVPQLDCSGDEFGSHQSSESNGTGDGRTHRSTAPRRGARRSSPEGRSPKRRVRRNSESPNRSVIISPHAAARFGNLDALKRLFLMLGTPDTPNALSFTCLHMAASYGHTSCVEWLLSNGGSANLDLASAQGWTPLHLACRAGHHESAQRLIDAGASLRLQDKYGRTPLHLACIGANSRCVEAILARDPEAVKDADGDKWGCVHYAARCNNAEVLQLLLNAQADPSQADHDGWTALHNCARNGQRRCAEILLASNASLLCTTRHSETALHVACRCSKSKVIVALLEAAAQGPNLAELLQMLDHRGCTPLMSCSSEEVRKQFERTVASLTRPQLGDIGKGLSYKSNQDVLSIQRTDEAAGGRTADPKLASVGYSCAPSKFCLVM